MTRAGMVGARGTFLDILGNGGFWTEALMWLELVVGAGIPCNWFLRCPPLSSTILLGVICH